MSETSGIGPSAVPPELRSVSESSRPHVINVIGHAVGYSEPFVAGPMFVRMCHRCGALVLDGVTLMHDRWHAGVTA